MLIPMLHTQNGTDCYGATTAYHHPNFSGGATEVVDAKLVYPWPCSGSFKHHLIEVGAAPGAAQSYTFAMMINGIAGLLVAITGASATQGSDLANTLAVTAGQRVNRRVVGSAGAGNTYYNAALLFQPSTFGQIPFIGAVGGAADYVGINGHFASGTESRVQVVVPFAGTFSALYACNFDGDASQNLVVTLRKDGNTALTCTIPNGSGEGTVASDLSNSVAVVAGDLVNMYLDIGATDNVSFGLVFTPDPPYTGAWWIPVHQGRITLSSAVKYNFINGGLAHQTTSDWQTTEGNRRGIWPNGAVIGGIALRLATAPGAGQSQVVTLYRNGSPSAVTVTISGTDTFELAEGFGLSPDDYDDMDYVADGSDSVASSSASLALFGGTVPAVSSAAPSSGRQGAK